MKIDTKKELKDLTGKPMRFSPEDTSPATIGSVISFLLSQTKSQGMHPFKAYELAMKFANQDSVELDKSDLDGIKKLIEGDSTFPPLVLGQLLGELREE